MSQLLKGAWLYRGFIRSAILNELKTRFARSRLGALWIILNPLAQVAIFAFVLSKVLSAKLPGIPHEFGYSIYLMSGIAAWTLFHEVVSRCLTVFVDNANLLKKQAFPRATLPVIAVGSALINNVLLIAAILVISLALGHPMGLPLLSLPILMVLTMLFGTSIGIILGTINVFLRDLSQIVPVGLQLLFWLTPIVYMVDILPSEFQSIIALNPLTPLVSGFQDAILFGRYPSWSGLLPIALSVPVLSWMAISIFRRASSDIVDSL